MRKKLDVIIVILYIYHRVRGKMGQYNKNNSECEWKNRSAYTFSYHNTHVKSVTRIFIINTFIIIQNKKLN